MSSGELLNRKSTAGVKVWRKKKREKRKMCVRGVRQRDEKRARQTETRREAGRGGTNKTRESETV